MEQTSMALQRAMAAEIRSRLGYMNRTQSWLQQRAKVPSATWRKYFTEGAIERDVPLTVVQRVASALGITTGELISLAEESAVSFLSDSTIPGATDEERKDLRRAISRVRPTRKSAGRDQSETGS